MKVTNILGDKQRALSLSWNKGRKRSIKIGKRKRMWAQCSVFTQNYPIETECKVKEIVRCQMTVTLLLSCTRRIGGSLQEKPSISPDIGTIFNNQRLLRQKSIFFSLAWNFMLNSGAYPHPSASSFCSWSCFFVEFLSTSSLRRTKRLRLNMW